jgi:hypothetical protein
VRAPSSLRLWGLRDLEGAERLKALRRGPSVPSSVDFNMIVYILTADDFVPFIEAGECVWLGLPRSNSRPLNWNC